MPLHRLLPLAAFCLLQLALRGQDNVLPRPLFRHLTYADGMLDNMVTVITQDQRGFLWFGYRNGLQRYDGEKFVTYPYYAVHQIQPVVRNHSLVMVAGKDQLKSIDGLTGAVITLPPGSGDATTFTDADGQPWRLSQRHTQPAEPGKKYRSGLAYLQRPHGAATPFHLLTDGNGQTWACGGASELLLLDETTKRLYSPGLPDGHPLFEAVKVKTDWARGMAMDNDGNLWIFSWTEHFFRYHIPTKKTHVYRLSQVAADASSSNKNPGWINHIFCDRQGTVWLATDKSGLVRYRPATDDFTSIKADLKDGQSLHYSFQVARLFQDREDNIWVGTDKGISYFNPYHQPFSFIKHEEGVSASLPADEINDVLETDDGDFLVGTWGGGIAVYGSDKRYKRPVRFAAPWHNQVWCLTKRRDGTVAAGCQYGVIHLLKRDGGVETVQPPETEKSTVRCAVTDAQGTTWLGLHNGNLVRWTGDGRFTNYRTAGKRLNVHDAAVNNLFISRNGTVWMATAHALKSFDPVAQKLTGDYHPQGAAYPPEFQQMCLGAEVWNDSLLLVGFEYLRLSFFNRHTRQFTPVAVQGEDRLLSVHAVTKDEAGTVWLTTSHDLWQWNVAGNKFVRSSPERGSLDGTFAFNRIRPLRNGEWVTFTNAEVLFFNPRQLRKEATAEEPVTITRVNVFEQAVPIDSLLHAGAPVVLSHGQNYLTIGFASLQFASSHAGKYLYRLKGLGDDWTAAGDKRFATYTALPPGEYHFEVKSDGGNRVTSFPIVIKPAFWQTTAFRVVVFSLAGLLIFGFVRWQINGVKNAARLKQRVAETEMAALRAQMNPHFIFNCINGIDALIQSNDKYNATVYLNKFAKLIRNILDSSKQTTVPLTKDLETLRLYIELEQFRSEGKFTAEVKADAHILQDDYRVPPLIVQPYVENAIQHGLRHRAGNEGKLTVNVSRENGSLLYRIEDNGVGRPENGDASADRSHYGLQMSGDRVKLFNKEESASVEITDLKEEGVAKGTRVRVWLKAK